MKMMYIDPGTGSMLISAIIALISVGFFMAKGFIYQKLNIGGKDSNKGASIDLSKSYGLVFYSEGKQYWNVFKPLLEECEKQSITATYFTSDEEDPGLDYELENINRQYIGTGREAYYVLNRLTADVLVMTTPGLDVLEIKKSKNIKHYSHVTHAAGSIAGYKAYGVDYYDSVLLGGEGDLEVISELESKRHLDRKEVKVIGNTYLDEYRKNIKDEKYKQSLFDNERPVVLVSPTWGNHGLLTKYGRAILAELEESDAYNVIIRPHPQSFISEEELMNSLMDSFPANENRIWDREFDGLISMSQADIMISDFSGIIFDFVSLFEKPILTVHEQHDKRGRDASDLDEEQWDLRILDSLGGKLTGSDIKQLTKIIDYSLGKGDELFRDMSKVKDSFDKYPGRSAIKGVTFIKDKLAEIRSTREQEVEENIGDKGIDSSELIYNHNSSGGIANGFREVIKEFLQPSTSLQILLTGLLLNLYILISQRLLPEEGLNQEFLNKLLPYSLFLIMILFTILVVLSWLKGKGRVTLLKEFEASEWKDILLISLPMTPIVQYILANQDMLSFSHSAKVFLFFMGLSLVMIVLLPFILSGIISKSLTLALSISYLFILLNMASFGRTVQSFYIGTILMTLSIGIFLTLYFKKKNILLVATSIFFVANIGSSFFNEDLVNHTEGIRNESRILKYTEGKTPINTPDVFLLIYESYSNQETMDFYGYDNSEQIDYLMDNGFAIYDGTYTLGPSSLTSMGRVLEPDFVGGSNDQLREAIAIQSGPVELFNKLDYRTQIALTNDYMVKGFAPIYDEYFPDEEYSIGPDKIIIDAILEGEFRFDVEFSDISYESYIETKQNILSENLTEPEFLYTHNEYPGHSQNSGVLKSNETDLHIDGIEKANKEMQEDIKKIQLENRDAIVIVAGDHGPYLTKNGTGLSSYDLDEINRMDIQDRYGAFLAIHWPDPTYEERYDIEILQDVFPAVISYIYEEDSLFDQTRMERETLKPSIIAGATVEDGMIVDGIDDGLPLFENTGVRSKNK